jgi:hypothetical protein
MKQQLQNVIVQQQQILLKKIKQSDIHKCVEGLACRYFLYYLISEIKFRDLPPLEPGTLQTESDFAMSGYFLFFGHSDFESNFINLFETHRKRNLFPKDNQDTLAFCPDHLLGICLGANSVNDNIKRKEMLTWITEILSERERKGGKDYSKKLRYHHVRSIIEKRPIFFTQNEKEMQSLPEQSLFYFCLRQRCIQVSNIDSIIPILKQQIWTKCIEEDISHYSAVDSALILFAFKDCIHSAIHDFILQPSHVANILSRFEDCMLHWQYDSNNVKTSVKWEITKEKHVQAILWVMLRGYFHDILRDDSLPKIGETFYKPDFGIPSLKLLIEVKYVKSGDEFKKIQKEIHEDSIVYLQRTDIYSKLLIFIYDASCSVEKHNTYKEEFKKLIGVEDVIIVCKPAKIL